jgi:hypothetical protein
MANDERHLGWRAQGSCNEQIALVLAVVVIRDDDDFTGGEGFDHLLNAIMDLDHLRLQKRLTVRHRKPRRAVGT